MLILPPPPEAVKLVSDSVDEDGKVIVDNSQNDSIWKSWLRILGFVEPFIEVATFSNSWANVGSPYYNAAYSQTCFRLVSLRGRIENGTSGAAAFVLPELYRPSATIVYGADGASGGGGGGLHARVEIDSSGNVIPYLSGGSPKLSLDGISFRAEQ